jgi:2,3,4,5-tetrahydropyridine-2-carboxylate N-succinyltransferase
MKEIHMHSLESIINAAYEQRDSLSPNQADRTYQKAVSQVIAALSSGTLRVAEKKGDSWQINQWLKKAVLLYFRLHENTVHSSSFSNFYDKVGLKYANYTAEQFKQDRVRVVPPACVREGVYIGPNCVLMPSYLNIGAYVDSGSMIDIWATIGSCAQIGKNTHISSNVCIGGVLEPLQANPTIIEDDCFIGTGSAIVEGTIIEQGSVIAMGVCIGQSTKIYDRETDEIYYGRVPAGSVVVPGSLPSKNGKYQSDCAIIMKKVDAKTRAKVSINELLREAD